PRRHRAVLELLRDGAGRGADLHGGRRALSRGDDQRAFRARGGGGAASRVMLAHTREADLAPLASLAGREPLDGSGEVVPFSLLLPAFVTSELKTAFQIGFLLLIPFLVIDLVVASVLMSMGMVMLSPLIISLPFKIMLFVLVDGWSLVMPALAGSFYRL